MSGTHAAPRFARRAAAVIDPAPKRPRSAHIPAQVATAPAPSETPLAPSVPFDGRRRPVQAVPEPLGPRPTPAPDPERDTPVDEDMEELYRGLQTHFEQFCSRFGYGV